MDKTILIVEDEADISKAIDFNLKKEGYNTLISNNGKDALDKINKLEIDLIILDLMIPEINGYDVLRAVRADRSKDTSRIPVIILTARSEEFDKLLGFEFGADDYMTKPFSIKELVARIKSVIRRTSQSAVDVKKQWSYKDFAVDFDKKVVSISKKEINLTAKEFKLLEIFIGSNGRVVSRDFLLNNVWDIKDPELVDTRTVDVHIMNLRKKLGKYGGMIRTVKNFGYRFDI
ncbi:MAG: response regulator transcription factor [Elusimicrobia bacterium]|jgi:DNA-binding response OmpR family regulator|nr:response regulator transcription factor [Elusimicrobiota bacterium]